MPTRGIMFVLILAAAAAGGFSFVTVPTLSFGEMLTRHDVGTSLAVIPAPFFPTHIHFVGDLFLGRRVETYMDMYGADFPYRRLTWSTTTPVVANFEAASPKLHLHTPDLTFRFSVDQSYLPALRQAGVTHVSLANNHAYDTGSIGFTETRVALAEAGVVPFGDHSITNESFTKIELASGTIAVVGVYAVDRDPDLIALANLLTAVSSSTVAQIAYVHWGAEYTERRTDSTARLAERLAGIGFDVIIGHHPHVVQDIAVIDGVPVFYSLGNFIFDQFFSQAVQEGLGVTLSIWSRALVFDLVPYTSLDARSQPREMVGEERGRFLRQLAAKSDPTLSEGIVAGTLTVPCESCNYQGID